MADERPPDGIDIQKLSVGDIIRGTRRLSFGSVAWLVGLAIVFTGAVARYGQLLLPHESSAACESVAGEWVRDYDGR